MVRNPFKSKIMIRIFRLTQGPTNTATKKADLVHNTRVPQMTTPRGKKKNICFLG